MYLRQYTIKGSALGIFKCWHAILLSSKRRHLYYLGSIGVRKVLVKLALYNRTHYFY